MKKVSQDFKADVSAHWTQGSAAILELAHSEALRLDSWGEDWEDMMNDKGAVGIICGETRTLGPDIFLLRFEAWLNRNDDSVTALASEPKPALHIKDGEIYIQKVELNRLTGKENLGIQVQVDFTGDDAALSLFLSVEGCDSRDPVPLDDCFPLVDLPNATFDGLYLLEHPDHATRASILSNILVREARLVVKSVGNKVQFLFIVKGGSLNGFVTEGWMTRSEAEHFFNFE